MGRYTQSLVAISGSSIDGVFDGIAVLLHGDRALLLPCSGGVVVVHLVAGGGTVGEAVVLLLVLVVGGGGHDGLKCGDRLK